MTYETSIPLVDEFQSLTLLKVDNCRVYRKIVSDQFFRTFFDCNTFSLLSLMQEGIST